VGRIELRGVRAHGRHGFEHELHHAQPFVVDADLEPRAWPADDDLDQTIDYALAVQEVRRVVEQESFSLIESLADAIASRLLAFGASRVRVRVSKPAAALALDVGEVAVTVERP